MILDIKKLSLTLPSDILSAFNDVSTGYTPTCAPDESVMNYSKWEDLITPTPLDKELHSRYYIYPPADSIIIPATCNFVINENCDDIQMSKMFNALLNNNVTTTTTTTNNNNSNKQYKHPNDFGLSNKNELFYLHPITDLSIVNQNPPIYSKEKNIIESKTYGFNSIEYASVHEPIQLNHINSTSFQSIWHENIINNNSPNITNSSMCLTQDRENATQSLIDETNQIVRYPNPWSVTNNVTDQSGTYVNNLTTNSPNHYSINNSSCDNFSNERYTNEILSNSPNHCNQNSDLSHHFINHSSSNFGQQNLLSDQKLNYQIDPISTLISYTSYPNSSVISSDNIDSKILDQNSHRKKMGKISDSLLANQNPCQVIKRDKPFVCEINNCQKRFVRIDELKRHQRIHSDVKQFICDICNKGFTRSDHLMTHRRTHTGERPYPCGYCERQFARSDERNRHMKTHLREKPKRGRKPKQMEGCLQNSHSPKLAMGTFVSKLPTYNINPYQTFKFKSDSS